MSDASSTQEAGTALKRVMADEGRMQSWLAQRTGIHYSQISRMVNGWHGDDAKRAAIAEALGRTVDELFPTVVALPRSPDADLAA